MGDVTAAPHGRGSTHVERRPIAAAPPRRIAIACGGTAGHVYPALAIADAYRRMIPGTDVLFVGGTGGVESRLVPAYGYRLAVTRTAPVLGVALAGKARAVIMTMVGMAQARRILRREIVHLVLGLGNYACAPAVLAAWSLGLPTLLHEANAVAGVANRFLGHVVDRVLLGFESAAAGFAKPTTVTGTPVRAEILALAHGQDPDGAPRPGLPARILVSGGSQGSRFLDERVPDLLARLVLRGQALEVRHQAAEPDLERVQAAYAGAGVRAQVVAYIDDMAGAYAWADFAVVCAGAVTLAEVSAVGLPVLLVPLASAALDHQLANARAFAAATGARWVREDAWAADALAAHVASLIASPSAWSAASAGVRRLARIDAAAAVIRACEAEIRPAAPSAERGSRAP
jgi:UDP-N-acetylglucosamine--N-acetylmuramyl-(pentapeptide) pyrophosphoryl-undecaprenol N-acetylglucosamine transferase